jgi:hypothetical protein
VKVQDQVPYVKRAERENNLELDRVMFVPHGEYTKCHQVLYFLNGQNRNVYYVYFTTIKNKRWIVGGVAQVAVCLPGKCKALRKKVFSDESKILGQGTVQLEEKAPEIE